MEGTGALGGTGSSVGSGGPGVSEGPGVDDAEKIGDENPLVTITVCVRDGVQWVDECMAALVAQDWPNFEVVAVDDGSSDGSGEVLAAWHDPTAKEHPCPVRVFPQGPLGLSAGRMLALQQAKGEWVAITDIDVRPERTWITQLMAARHPLSEGEDVVAVTGRTVFEPGDSIVSKIRATEIARKYRSRPRLTSLANGPCSIFRKQALMAIGGFDPNWYHAEDMQVSLLLLEAGGCIIYSPDAVVNHVPEESLQRFMMKRTRDTRAHLRIVRQFPRRRRKGPGFDFIGSTWLVLTHFPLLILQFAVLPLIIRLFHEGLFITPAEQMMAWPEATLFIIGFSASICETAIRMLGPFRSFVNWNPLRKSKNMKFGLLLYAWSFALWKGLFLGCMDALLGRNGHRRR